MQFAARAATTTRVAVRHLHTARPLILQPAAAAASAASAAPATAASSGRLSAAAVLAEEAKRDVVFPLSAKRQAYLAAKAAAEAAAAQPKPPKMVRVAMPRYMQQRTEPKKVLPAAKPVRHTTKEGAIKVNWKVSEHGWWLCGPQSAVDRVRAGSRWRCLQPMAFF